MSFPYRGAVVLGVSDEEVQEVLIPIRLTLERYSFAARAREDDRRRLRGAREADLADGAGGEGERPAQARRGRPPLPRDRDRGVGAAAHGADLAHDLAADPRLLLPLRALSAASRRRSRSIASCSPPSRRAIRAMLPCSSATSPCRVRRPRAERRRGRRSRAAKQAGRTRMTELLAVENLRTGFDTHGRRHPRRRRRRLRDRAGRDARRRRRVGQRQVRDRALDHAPDRPAGPDRGGLAHPVRRAATSPRSREDEMAKIRGNDISMIFQEPMTSLNPVFTVGDQIAEAVRLHQKRRPARRPTTGRSR